MKTEERLAACNNSRRLHNYVLLRNMPADRGHILHSEQHWISSACSSTGRYQALAHVSQQIPPRIWDTEHSFQQAGCPLPPPIPPSASASASFPSIGFPSSSRHPWLWPPSLSAVLVKHSKQRGVATPARKFDQWVGGRWLAAGFPAKLCCLLDISRGQKI